MCAELVHEAVHAAHQPVALVEHAEERHELSLHTARACAEGSPRLASALRLTTVGRSGTRHGHHAMGSCECYVVSCRARDREQPRCLCQRGGSAAAATYRGRGEVLRVAVGDGQLLAGDRRLVAGCVVRYRDVGKFERRAAGVLRNRIGARTMSSASLFANMCMLGAKRAHSWHRQSRILLFGCPNRVRHCTGTA